MVIDQIGSLYGFFQVLIHVGGIDRELECGLRNSSCCRDWEPVFNFAYQLLLTHKWEVVVRIVKVLWITNVYL